MKKIYVVRKGPTIVGVFDTEQAANDYYDRLEAAGHFVTVDTYVLNQEKI